ncbi:hypothetical protein D0439_16310 [Lysinibacillus fusiformis]|jgi:DNA-binding transcriptional MerR regulator|uniref:hypothetical protein n=1 Tax=Lysinibacillus TaxID=400634 RepID=UPI0004D8103C|nr:MULTISPECIES: hypothetical protein [Lysinibacillus]MDC6268920.1 hypothetical protein [Lysinibacillus sphaericus]AJK88771.1 hypothetical protein HR49_17360 [Lysinibacillus fusiformis]KAB0441633.1 hypothetical protein CH314_16570 [Lysinibacillus fusiformis]KGA83025.1 hypothetical protein KQ41_11020 [Lysinibacillus fusiformis]KHK48514.1 hypothetical protein PI85_23185 [Lysinibacillus sp. A1]
MLKVNDAKEMVLGIVQDDPLFVALQHTPLEESLYNDDYLADIDETNHYTIAEIAGWFDITDAMLRYYLKPFEQYIFDNATPNEHGNIRLDLPAILRLRMILLLKDEYRVKGIKLLLGIDDNGQLLRHQITATTMDSGDLSNKIDVLGNVLQQMIQTGLFQILPDEKHGTLQVNINQEFLAENIQRLSSDSALQFEEIQKETSELKQENENLQQQITELQENGVKEIVQKIRERHIENEIVSTLRTEALQQFSMNNQVSFFKRMFRSSQIEMEKEQFVLNYISTHLEERLEVALNDYYGK